MSTKGGQTVAYLRVSSEDQNLERQSELKEDADKVFEEKASAGTRERPRLEALLNHVREGDLVRVWSIDRLARSMSDLDNIVQELKARGVSIEFVKEGMLFDPTEEEDHFKKLLFQILGSFAEFERAISKARQKEGIAKAKAAGKYKGRKAVILSDEQLATLKQKIEMKVPKTIIAKELGIGRTRLYDELKKMRAEEVVA